MNKEDFSVDNELAALEEELAQKFDKIKAAPLRADFRDALRSRIEEKTAVLSQNRKIPRLKGFFSGLQNNLHKLRPSRKIAPPGPVFTGKRKIKLVASFILVAFMFTAVFYGLDRLGIFLQEPVLAAEINIQAVKQDRMGIDPETAFILTSNQPLDEKTVRENLKVSPQIDFKLEKGEGGREYKILPEKKLLADTIYKWSFDTSGQGREAFSWAFQTKGSFRVISGLPMTRSTHVSVDTGIEITFSHENFDLAKSKDYFVISPQVEGRFEQHKKTLVFVPQKLEPATIYTVTVKKGFPVLDSTQTLAEDYTFSFETGPEEADQEQFTFDMDTRLQEFAVNEPPAFQVYFNAEQYKNTSKQAGIPQPAVKVYKYADYQAYVQALAARDEIPEWSYLAIRNYRANLGGLEKAAEFQIDFLSADNYSHYVLFPAGLPAGYYAAEIKAGDCTRQVWFQVSDLVTYLAYSEEKALLWVNDLQSKKPVPNIEVEVVGHNLTAKGDTSGVAVLDFGLKGKSGEKTIAYARISAGTKEAIAPLGPYYELATSLQARDYWKYLYLERNLFKPGDLLHFWGVLAPRAKGVREIREVEVELRGSSGYYYSGRENSPILTQKVPVNNKTYEGSLQLPVLKPDYYYLQIKTGDVVLQSQGFSVETYQKPAYQLALTGDKKAVFAGEAVNFQVQASFFEGTPVPGLVLNYHLREQNGTVTTSDAGTARITYTAQFDEDHYSQYSNQYLWVSNNLPEFGEISAEGNVYVFRSQVYLKGEVTRQEEDFNVSANLSLVDLSKINAGQILDEKNFLAKPAANTLINGSIYQNVWEKVEAGERYDFISKKVVKSYYYNHSTRHISDFSMTTDAEGQATYTGKLSPENSYYIILTAQDAQGRKTVLRLNVPGPSGPGYDDYKYYTLAGPAEGKVYLPGERVSLTFMENDSPLSSREKAFLYFRGQKQIDVYEVSGSPTYEFDFQTEYIPNVNVFGVYFDGSTYRETGGRIVAFNRESRLLQVEIKTDKPQYRPGETVSLEVWVKDRKNNPVAAEVNLNLVDEAIYSMVDQQVDLLNAIYNDYIHIYLNTWQSHSHPLYGGGAEKGGEGGSYRKDFRDTVLFTSLQTNSAGQAQTEFKLPDNLTSWRITYHAVSPSLLVGSGTSQLPVKLPFFVEVLANETYLAGDAPTIVLRSYGEELDFQDPVAYNLKLLTPQGKEITHTGQGSAFTPFDWKLPALEEGRYSLIIEGKSGPREDKLIKEFTVVKSYLERTVTRQELLSDTFSLKGLPELEEPLTLLFSDYEKSQYLRGIYRLAWQSGSRFEQQLAAKVARRLLTQYFPEEKAYFGEEQLDVLLSYQRPDGGIAILPYAESELYLTALAASCAKDSLDQRAMSGYFYRFLEESEDENDHSAALWGLSALGEPVLLQVNEMLGKNDLAPAQKINLALAMLDIGNGAVSQKVFDELLKEYGEDLGSTMRINVGRDQDEIIAATTQMAVLAARLNHPQKNKLYQYLLENEGKDILNLAEEALILRYNLQYMDAKEVGFTYELQGKEFTKTLKGRETFKLTVLPQDLASLRFSDVKGKVGVIAAYTTSYKAEDITPQEGLKVDRAYLVAGKEVSTLGRSDLVQVTITYEIGDKAPQGSYEIVDVLPSGLCYLPRPYERQGKTDKYLAYPTEVKGQKLTFPAFKGGTNKLVYYARVVSPGEYTGEGTLLSNVRSNSICVLGAEDRINIK